MLDNQAAEIVVEADHLRVVAPSESLKAGLLCVLGENQLVQGEECLFQEVLELFVLLLQLAQPGEKALLGDHCQRVVETFGCLQDFYQEEFVLLSLGFRLGVGLLPLELVLVGCVLKVLLELLGFKDHARYTVLNHAVDLFLDDLRNVVEY